jgi:hypothetical protein
MVSNSAERLVPADFRTNSRASEVRGGCKVCWSPGGRIGPSDNEWEKDETGREARRRRSNKRFMTAGHASEATKEKRGEA